MTLPKIFEHIVSYTIAWETGGDKSGAYTNDPSDAGGETKWGISKKANPDLNIKTLTYREAIDIYRGRYWNPFFNIFPDLLLTYKVFDMGVLNGTKVAIKYLQKSIITKGKKTIKVDGLLGPITVAALGVAFSEGRGDLIIEDYINRFRTRVYWIILAKPWNLKYRKGWLRRINDVGISRLQDAKL